MIFWFRTKHQQIDFTQRLNWSLAKSLDFRQAELDRQDELDAVEPTVEAAATDFLAKF